MARLRAPGGCPWDREQNFDTIKPYLLEETYEVLDAIDQRDWPGLAEELGDLMLQAVFFAQMASEEGKFRHRRFAGRHFRKADPPPSARFRRRLGENLRRRQAPLGRNQGGREEAREDGQGARRAVWIRCRANSPRWWKPSRSAPRPPRSASIGKIPAKCSTNWMKSCVNWRRRARAARLPSSKARSAICSSSW